MAESTEKKNLFQKLGRFFKSLKAEFRKIVWPNKSQLTKQTIAVIIVSLILGAFIAGIDVGTKELVGLMSKVKLPTAAVTETTDDTTEDAAEEADEAGDEADGEADEAADEEAGDPGEADEADASEDAE